MRNHGAHGGVKNRGSGEIAGEHLVSGLGVIGNAAGDRADDGDLVRDLGGAGEVLTEDDAGDFCLDDAERATIFDGSFGLGIPGFLMGETAGEDDLDDALSLTLRAFAGVGGGANHAGAGVHAEEIREAEAHAAEKANLDETTAVEGGRVDGTWTAMQGAVIHRKSSSVGRELAHV
jgi:hypothetical protein